MNKDGTWNGWTFKLGDKAFKAIRPRNMLLKQERTREAVSTKWFFFTNYMNVPTGRWSIALTFDRGPGTRSKVERVFFKNEKIARDWYNTIYDQIFLDNTNHKVPPPPKKKRPSTVKKKVSHLSVVKD